MLFSKSKNFTTGQYLPHHNMGRFGYASPYATRKCAWFLLGNYIMEWSFRYWKPYNIIVHLTTDKSRVLLRCLISRILNVAKSGPLELQESQSLLRIIKWSSPDEKHAPSRMWNHLSKLPHLNCSHTASFVDPRLSQSKSISIQLTLFSFLSCVKSLLRAISNTFSVNNP